MVDKQLHQAETRRSCHQKGSPLQTRGTRALLLQAVLRHCIRIPERQVRIEGPEGARPFQCPYYFGDNASPADQNCRLNADSPLPPAPAAPGKGAALRLGSSTPPRDAGSADTAAGGPVSHSRGMAAGPHLDVAPATRPTAGSGRHQPAGSAAAAPRAPAARTAPAARAESPSSWRPPARRLAGRGRAAPQQHSRAQRPLRPLPSPPGSRAARLLPVPHHLRASGCAWAWGAPDGRAQRTRPVIATPAPPACACNKGLR